MVYRTCTTLIIRGSREVHIHAYYATSRTFCGYTTLILLQTTATTTINRGHYYYYLLLLSAVSVDDARLFCGNRAEREESASKSQIWPGFGEGGG